MPSTIDPPPAVPNRQTQDRLEFVQAADAFVGWLSTFRSQLIVVTGEVYDAAELVETTVEEIGGYVTAAEAARDEAEGFRDEAQAVAAFRVSIARKTWAELEAIEGTADQTAAVFDDGDTHTDPVTSATVDNEGIYRYSVADEGWERLADLSAVDAVTPAFADITGSPGDNSALASALGAKLDKSGGTMTGALTLAASNGLIFGDGAPGSPSTGQMWYLSGTLQYRSGTGTTHVVATNVGPLTLFSKTLAMPVIDGIAIEDVYTISDGAAFSVDPANGGIQKVTLGANRTPTLSAITSGRWVLLLVDDGSAYTLTLSGVTWMTGGGSAPTLKTSGYTAILLMHDGVSLKAWLCGDAG